MRCDWANCDVNVAGRLPPGWARIFVCEPALDDEGCPEEGCEEERDYLLCPRHLIELRSHLRTEPTIERELPEGAKIQFVGGELPPQPCIWKGCKRISSRRYGGSIVILTDENRLLRDLCGVGVEGESDLCPVHMATLADFLQVESKP